MKRWTRSIPFLVATPLVLVAGLLLSHVPSLKVTVDFFGGLLFLLVFCGQLGYLLLRDKAALEPFVGSFMLAFGLLWGAIEYSTPMQGLTSQQVFLIHATIFTIIVAGGAWVYGYLKNTQPKQWWATFQMWQGQVSSGS